jgi:hypothetical protein
VAITAVAMSLVVAAGVSVGVVPFAPVVIVAVPMVVTAARAMVVSAAVVAVVDGVVAVAVAIVTVVSMIVTSGSHYSGCGKCYVYMVMADTVGTEVAAVMVVGKAAEGAV